MEPVHEPFHEPVSICVSGSEHAFHCVGGAGKRLYLLTLGVWIGSISFFSFVVAPTVFKVLKPEDAAKLQRAMFPKYYLTGIVCVAVGIVCVGFLLSEGTFGKWPGVLSLLLL